MPYMGIEDSIYCGGDYVFDDNSFFYYDTKIHDDFVTELESLGCTKVDELPDTKNITVDDKWYYTDSGKRVSFRLPDNYWTGKTSSDGTVIVNTINGHATFDENGKCINYEN